MSETNTKPNVEKLNNDRQQQQLSEVDFNTNGTDLADAQQKLNNVKQLYKIEQNCAVIANGKRCEENKWGQKITIDQKIEEIKEDKSFPYSIPILGDFLKKREIRKLEAKKEINKIRLMRDMKLTRFFPDLDQREHKQKEEIKKIQQEQTKGFNQYILQSQNKLTPEQKQEIMRIINGQGIDNNDVKTQQQTQTQIQTKEAEVVKPNPAAIAASKENVQQNQAVAPAPQTQTQSKETGMQIGNLGNAGTTISSGNISVGTGQGQSKSGPQI